VVTRRAGAEACRQVDEEARPVARVAAELGVCWWTVMNAVTEHGTPVVDDPDRVGAVRQLGVDGTSFLSANRLHATNYATGLVDLEAKILIDMVEGNTALSRPPVPECQRSAACRGTDPTLFHGTAAAHRRAPLLCRRCPVAEIQTGLGVTADGGVPVFHRAYDGGADEVNPTLEGLQTGRKYDRNPLELSTRLWTGTAWYPQWRFPGPAGHLRFGRRPSRSGNAPSAGRGAVSGAIRDARPTRGRGAKHHTRISRTDRPHSVVNVRTGYRPFAAKKPSDLKNARVRRLS